MRGGRAPVSEVLKPPQRRLAHQVGAGLGRLADAAFVALGYTFLRDGLASMMCGDMTA
jgi:hypothetical protein